MEYQKTESTRLLRIKQVQEMTGLSRSYIYALGLSGKFPKSISLVPGGSSRAWLNSQVQDWIDERVEAGKQEASNV